MNRRKASNGRTLSWLWSALLLAFLSACLATDVVVCAGGLVCPAGSQCDDVRGKCVSTEQARACDRKDEGAECSFPGVPAGHCYGGLCEFSGCGNGFLDPGEACDDGDTEGGDGCSADCLSDETCGNGVVDVFQFGSVTVAVEECDDGNDTDLDGCTAQCRRTDPAWERGGLPEGEYAIAYDASRARVVIFGGTRSPPRRFTWEWDGGTWLDISPAEPDDSPPLRDEHAMVFDSARGRVVLFGGSVSGAAQGDTWEWDGSVWTNVTPAGLSPPPRWAHAMAYDAGRKRTVVFGGLDGDYVEDDGVWEWDGSEWTHVAIAAGSSSPDSRTYCAMAYDAGRGRVVMFGGARDGAVFGDTWEWDGSAWTELSPADKPPARSNHSMVYDVSRGRVLLFGGSANFGMGRNDVWEWDGSDWTEISPDAAPGAPYPFRFRLMAYDTLRQRVVVAATSQVGTPDTLEWDGSGWSEMELLSPLRPESRGQHAMAYDAQRGRVVLFGGSDVADERNDTWEWDGTSWIDVTPVLAEDSPPPRRSHAIAYDAARRRVVLFGGLGPSSTPLEDTWEWDGSTWSEVTPAESPAGRSAVMAYDAARERVVLFGGYDGSVQRADTWEWDGSRWTEVMPSTSMEMRQLHAMAYDVERRQVVLFGGRTTANTNETWIWDGVDWAQAMPSTRPLARRAHALSYDVASKRIVLFGGTAVQVFPDTVEWNGSAWLEPQLAESPPARSHHAMAYDAARGRTVLFGGSDGVNRLDDTWRFSYRAVGPKECHTGMDGDGDGLIGCADADCWGYCTPHCPPTSVVDWPADCPTSEPRCGDGACSEYLESCRLCPEDCGACEAVCGDFHCDPGESVASCPGDCTP